MEYALARDFRAVEGGSLRAIAKIGACAALAAALIIAPLWGVKLGVILAGFAFFLAAAFLLPLAGSFCLFFLYLYFDGALKILSNYHPVMHVGQDIFLLALFARVLADPEFRVRDWYRTPFFLLFSLFAGAVLLQYLNPFSLGLLPSIAGTKVYFSGVLLFFLLYHGLRGRQGEWLVRWIVFLGLLQAVIALVEYFFFPEQIFSLHPKYRQLAGERFVGSLYRPFGTTAGAGAPSLWVFLCAPFAYYLLAEGKRWRWRFLALAFFALGLPVLVVCQTRSAMVLTALMLLAGLAAPARRWLPKLLLGALVFGAIALFSEPAIVGERVRGALQAGGVDPLRAEFVEKRVSSLFEAKTYATARGGAWMRSVELAALMPFGIGLSRVGAASAVWKERIDADPDFGRGWAFADNVYRALFTELGIVGLAAWLLLVLGLAVHLVRKSRESRVRSRRVFLWMCGAVPFVILVGGWGSEGVLYMPVSAFLWGSLALGLRESEYV